MNPVELSLSQHQNQGSPTPIEVSDGLALGRASGDCPCSAQKKCDGSTERFDDGFNESCESHVSTLMRKVGTYNSIKSSTGII